MKDLIFVEFSLSQKAFHKYSLQEMIEKNYESVIGRKQSDYIPIAYFLSNDAADKFIHDNYNLIKDYSMFRSTKGETIVF